jgi:Predicted Rossmann fold nucleotide-binding protein involved in DNA uptake
VLGSELRSCSDTVFIPSYSSLFPILLKSYSLCPKGLYVTPPLDISRRRFIGVVGTRFCSDWGCRTAREVGKFIASKGFSLVTGLASGIDLCTSLSVLEYGGFVVGVRPWLRPLNLPLKAKKLIEEYRGKVVLISEYYVRPPNVGLKYLYFLRNRIIAGISELVIIIEARTKGGSLHQIKWCIMEGKPLAVFKHPYVGSDYYRAYEKLKKYRGIIIFKDIDDLKSYIEKNMM